MKKKIVAVLLCLTLAFSVTDCGKDKKSESVENTERQLILTRLLMWNWAIIWDCQ